MNCASCGHTNPEHAKFCLECGGPMTADCANCGTTLPPAAKFCLECGTAVGGVTAGSRNAGGATKQAQRSPASYTPKHLAEKILQSKSALEGERKQVTVLFADVKSSMELSEQLDPEEWHRILERFFEILTEGVHRFEGTVNQYTGDGIMALFGAPIAHEDHAQRACYAALALRDALREFSRDVKRQYGLDFATRMGLNSGEVVVGRIGDDLRMDYTAQGHTVGLAQRMESLASGGSIYLSDHTARLVQGYFALEDLGAFTLKGAAEPMAVHELIGVGSARTRFDVSRARGFSRFVGRAADMRTLEDALEKAAAGNGQVIGVVAEAGTGKSRLCFEFLERCRGRGLQVFEARAVAHGKNIPLLPILELFRAYFSISAQDDEHSTREKIAGRMVMLDRKFADTLPLIFDFLGVADAQNPAPPLDPDARQRQLLGVMRQVMQSASQTRPMLTLIEDLHWLDAASAEFLEHIVEAREGNRSLLLLNFRPEYHAGWMQKSWYRQIPLTPLGRDAIAELLADLLGNHPSIAALAGPIHTRTGGNPFFTEEVAQSLIESGHLEGRRGAYELVTPIERLEVPATVQAVLAARIDRLPEREKRLLQVASVIGKDFSEPLLAKVAQLPADELKAALVVLQRAEFIHEQSIYPIVEYSFKHPLTQEVAQGSQLRERRNQVHATVAKVLEAAGGNLDERAAEIAYHWAEAAEPAHAARWYGRAAAWAGRSNIRQALAHWRRVRELAPAIEKHDERDALAARACDQILNLGAAMGGTEEEMASVFAEGRVLAERAGDRQALALFIGRYGVIRLVNAGSAIDLVRYAEEAVRIAELFTDPGARATVWAYAAYGQMTAGYPHSTLAWSRRIQNEVGSDNRLGMDLFGNSPRAAAFHTLGWAHLYSGAFNQSEHAFDDCIQTAEEVGNQERINHALAALAWLGIVRGGDRNMVDYGRRAVELAEAMDNESTRSYALFAVGAAQLLNGQFEAARDACLRSIAMAHDLRTARHWIPLTLTVLSKAYLRLGENRESATTAREGAVLGETGGLKYIEAQARLALAAALIEQDGTLPQAEIQATLNRVQHLADITGGDSLLPELREQQARLAAKLGDAAASNRWLHEAFNGYQEIGATGHVARLATELTP